MQTKRLGHDIAAAAYRNKQNDMQILVYRMLGKCGEPRKPLKETRREIAGKLDGISVSRMIIEAR